MTPSLALQLDRFRDLIAQVGIDAIFSAPLVTPGNEWFPDRWGQDYESVRLLLLRLAEYAGLSDLDVEVLDQNWEPAVSQMPAPVMEQRAAGGLTGSFHGIHEGRAWFTIDWRLMDRPVKLVGILAHEMAHAWRQARGIHVTPHQAEEECTDLTAIALGFGILVANAAYEYRVAGSGLLARTQWSHSVSGHLEVDDMAGLLACWARLKDLPAESILKHLGATQADAFRKAWARWEEDAIRERLGVAEDVRPTPPRIDGAREREFPPSLAARRVHECVKRVVELAGEDGGLVPEPIPFPALVATLPNRILARWARISAADIWFRVLALVADPEWDTEAIVVTAWTGGVESACFVVGHVRDAHAHDARRLGALIAPAFADGSPHRSLLVPALPTCLAVAEDAERFGMRELEPMFREVADHAGPEQIASETEWLQTYAAHTRLRLDAERAHGGVPPAPAARADFKRWWSVVADPAVAKEEMRSARWYGTHYVIGGPRPAPGDEKPDTPAT